MKMKKAFTIVEMLIILGVIGVIAALTIPDLIKNIHEKVLIHQLQETYTIFSQAYKLAIAENDSPEGWDIGSTDTKEGSLKLYEYIKPHLKKVEDCSANLVILVRQMEPAVQPGCWQKEIWIILNEI